MLLELLVLNIDSNSSDNGVDVECYTCYDQNEHGKKDLNNEMVDPMDHDEHGNITDRSHHQVQ